MKANTNGSSSVSAALRAEAEAFMEVADVGFTIVMYFSRFACRRWEDACISENNRKAEKQHVYHL